MHVAQDGFDVFAHVGEQRYRHDALELGRDHMRLVGTERLLGRQREIFEQLRAQLMGVGVDVTHRADGCARVEQAVEVGSMRVIIPHRHALREALARRHRPHGIEHEPGILVKYAAAEAVSITACSCSALRAFGLGTSESGERSAWAPNRPDMNTKDRRRWRE